MYLQPPLTEQEIAQLPLVFVPPNHYEHEVFTEALIAIWVALTESGSLATLPPVPDIVGFADTCTVFYLIYHTKPSQLSISPEKRLTSRPTSPTPSSSSFSCSSPPPYSSSPGKDSPSKSTKRAHPYAHARPSSSKNQVDSSDEDGFKYYDPTDREVIGCVYLAYKAGTEGCADIGIALRPEARGRGYGRAALTYLLRVAFEQHGLHRVVANVFGPNPAEPNRGGRESVNIRWVFEKIGFKPEGVQRLAGFSATDGVWRDVYPLSMLDLDWLALNNRQSGRESIETPWDSMVERHDEERDQMMNWMDDASFGKIRRVKSTDTIKGLAMMDAVDEAATDIVDETATDTEETGIEEPEQHLYTTDNILDIVYQSVRNTQPPSAPESVLSGEDWRSSTPSTDFSVISHSPPPPPHISDSDWHTDYDFDTDDFESLDEEGSTRGLIHTTD